jgi:hypothetical protein
MDTYTNTVKERGLLRTGLAMVGHNKRYIFWFWVLNLALGWFGTVAFGRSAHAILDHSLYANHLMRSFDMGVVVEMFARPEFGKIDAVRAAAGDFALLFFVATVLFLPGVFEGFAANYRLPRDEFFRACGRNLWRYIRLLIMAGIVMVIATAALFGLHGLLEHRAAESTNELLLPEVRGIGLLIIFLIMATLRICFDLAEVDVVLSDQNATRKSIAAGFRHTFRSLGRLLGSYVLITIVAAIILLAGFYAWHMIGPEHVLRPFIVGQIILFLLLIPRFWQRGVVVAYWQRAMVEPVAAPVVTPAPVTPQPVVATGPAPAPAITSGPPSTAI